MAHSVVTYLLVTARSDQVIAASRPILQDVPECRIVCSSKPSYMSGPFEHRVEMGQQEVC